VQTGNVFGIPPFPQERAERMGHGNLSQEPKLADAEKATLMGGLFCIWRFFAN